MKVSNNNSNANLALARGFTLVEVLLVVALLAILSAASFGLIYWQMATQSHISQAAMGVNKLVNTQLLMRKVLRTCNPASLSVNLTHDVIVYQEAPLPAPAIELFSYTSGNLKYRNDVILENMVASFSHLVASGAAAVPAIAPLSIDRTHLLKIDLATDFSRETRNLSFIVRPRGY